MRTLVTGGAGFIGRCVVSQLLDRGDEVVVLDTFEAQVHKCRPPSVPDGVALITGNVGDPDVTARALEGVDQIVHLAAAVGVGQSMYEIDNYVRLNTMATATFLEQIVNQTSRPARLVVASSMSIYGEGAYECLEDGRVTPSQRSEAQLAAGHWEVMCPMCRRDVRPVPTGEDKPLVPTSVYAITKRDQEEMCLVVGAAYGIPTVALRFFNVYGPGQSLSNPYTGVAAIFASRLLNKRPPTIFEDGTQSRDFIHVDDIVGAILLALESDRAVGQTINVGTGQSTTVGDVARALAAGLGADIEPERLRRYRAGDIRHCFADPTRAKDLLGFSARVPLDEGMAGLIDWLEGQDAEDNTAMAGQELVARGLTKAQARTGNATRG